MPDVLTAPNLALSSIAGNLDKKNNVRIAMSPTLYETRHIITNTSFTLTSSPDFPRGF